MKLTWLIVLFVLPAGPADPNNPAAGRKPQPRREQPATRPARDRFAELQQQAARLIGATRQLGDWNEHYGYIMDAVERVYDRNGWTSESDLFSLELLGEVSAIPPWDVRRRFDALTARLAERYVLDEDQTASMRHLLVRESADMFRQHAGRIMQYGLELIQTRAAGEPFTAEQVARWAELARPVFVDSRRRMTEIAREFMEQLEPEQRELVQRDLEAANRRMDAVEKMGDRWARGEWDPRDWGLEEDPIQNGTRAAGGEGPDSAAAAAEQAAGGQARSPRPARGGGAPPSEPPVGEGPAVEETVQPSKQRGQKPTAGPDSDGWARYVRAFIARYDLNAEQQQKAWLIYRDADERRAAVRKRFDRRVADVRVAGNADEDKVIREQVEQRERDLGRLFEQLKQRLERLPTRSQRKAAEPAGAAETPATRPARPRRRRQSREPQRRKEREERKEVTRFPRSAICSSAARDAYAA